LSFAINLPASALVALGVRMGRFRQTDKATNGAIATENETPEIVTASKEAILFSTRAPRRTNPATEAERFVLAMLRPTPNARLTPGDLRSAYIDWCEQMGTDPLPIQDFAPALGKMFRKAGIAIVDGNAFGVAIERLSR
jgi:hypothetical protein